MHRRTGVTLVEVLIAIFVMAIGLMALLTLFPIGALRMAQAIQDTHTANAANNATAIASANAFRFDANVVAAFSSPGGGLPDLSTINPNGPSYPVLVDAVGFQAYGGTYQTWVGGSAGIPRRSVTAVTGTANKQPVVDRWFTYLDDYNFGADGLVPAVNGSRDYRYSWAYLMCRPRLSSPLVELTVVVYRGRPSTITAFESSGKPLHQRAIQPQRQSRDADPGGRPGSAAHQTGGLVPGCHRGKWHSQCQFLSSSHRQPQRCLDRYRSQCAVPQLCANRHQRPRHRYSHGWGGGCL